MSDLRGGKEHRRAIGAGRDTGPTAYACRCVERTVGIPLGHRGGVGVGSGARRRRNVATSLNDPIEGPAIDYQVLDHRERAGSPWFHVDHVAILEGAHVELAGRRLLWTVRHTIDH